jgi:hypothetical protein
MTRATLAVLLLAACAPKPPAAPPAPVAAASPPPAWEFGRVPGPPPACYARLATPRAIQDFLINAAGIPLFVVTAPEGTTLAPLMGDQRWPADAPYPEAGPGQLGTVLQHTDRRLAVRLADRGTLSGMLQTLEAQRTRDGGDAAGPDPRTRLAACLATIAPPG